MAVKIESREATNWPRCKRYGAFPNVRPLTSSTSIWLAITMFQFYICMAIVLIVIFSTRVTVRVWYYFICRDWYMKLWPTLVLLLSIV